MADSGDEPAFGDESLPSAVNHEVTFATSEDGGGESRGGEEEGSERSVLPMDPNNPLLRRAQEALKRQLLQSKQEVEERLRERVRQLKDAQRVREDVGVELYGVQQQLAKLQMALERSQESYLEINKIRVQAESDVADMRSRHGEHSTRTEAERARAEAFQKELDKLAATLKQVEAYNEEMKDEIAVTRRATYVAEEAVSRLEKEKREQDLVIEQLQETLKRQAQQISLYDAQLQAQEKETRAAQDTLSEAATEMENVNFEKKQLTAQWKSSLIAMTRRDEALQVMEDSLKKQREQELAVESEMEGFKKAIKAEQERNEQLTGMLAKVEGQSQFLGKQIDTMKAKRDHLCETFSKLKRSLEETEAAQATTKAEARGINFEIQGMEKSMLKHSAHIQEVEAKMLDSLSDQTTMEKSAQTTVLATRKLRQRTRDETTLATHMQNELARMRVDILTTQSHNGKLREAVSRVDQEVCEKGALIEKYELEIRRRHDEIEKKTKEVDRLNRQYDKLTANMSDESTGPLENTISNITREIASKGVDSKDLQRRWVSVQTELVGLTRENNALAERVQQLRGDHTVLRQRRARLDAQHDAQRRDIHAIDGSVRAMHGDLARLNELIARNSSLQQVLANENFTLETNIVAGLKEMESDVVRLEARIEASKSEKRNILMEIVEMERHIMLWERKIALEKETQAAIDPNIGNDVVGAMKKEIHRMKLRHTELLKRQEKLISDMEVGIYKRDHIATKGKVLTQKNQGGAAPATEAQAAKACADLRRTTRDTERESAALDGRIRDMEGRREQLAGDLDNVERKVCDMRDREEALRTEIDTQGKLKMKELFVTSAQQRSVKRYEEIEAGKWKGFGEIDVPTEVAKAQEKKRKILEVVGRLLLDFPHLEPMLTKVQAIVQATA